MLLLKSKKSPKFSSLMTNLSPLYIGFASKIGFTPTPSAPKKAAQKSKLWLR